MPPFDEGLHTNDERIAWVLAHPGMSPWLKEALRSARQRDPVEVLNELEILNLLLRTECEARIRIAFPDFEIGSGGLTRNSEIIGSAGQSSGTPK